MEVCLRLLQYIVKNTATKILSFLLAVSTLLGGYLAIQEIFFSSEIAVNVKPNPEYTEKSIPLVYTDISKFKKFLRDNVGNVVKINSQISFDIVLPESKLAHEACNFDDFIGAVLDNSADVANKTLGLPSFSKNIKSANLNYIYDNELKKEVWVEDTSGLVTCSDQLRILVKDPRSLRLSYGGTGTISLPLWGVFLVELRAYSGPSAEYTLREL